MLSNISGLIVPIVTPKLGKKVDNLGLVNLVNFLIKNCVDALFVLGTTGEFQYLSLTEKKKVILTVTRANKNRTKIFVGISAYNLKEIKSLLKYAKECGADAVILAPLFGNNTVEPIINFVIKNSLLPIIFYNNPVITKNRNLDISIVRKFKNNPKIIGIKDSSGNKNYFHKLLKLKSEHFPILQGDEESIFGFLNNEASGFVPGSANIFPKEFKLLFLEKDKLILAKLLQMKKRIAELSPNYIMAIKKKLMEMKIINSDELFYR